MKRVLVISLLGAAVCFVANQAWADGWILFCNYSGSGQMAPVTYQGPAFGGCSNGETIGKPFKANLLYSLDGGATYVSANAPTDFLFPCGTAVASGGGLFGNLANQVIIPGYSSGAVDFIVQVYNGATYASSTMIAQSGVAVASELASPSNLWPVGDYAAEIN